MNTYNYDKNTKEFLSVSIAKSNPREPGKFLVPLNSTIIEPPEVNENEVAVFIDGNWTVESDFRNIDYWDINTKEKTRITEIGETPGSDLTNLEPGRNQIWDAFEWIDDLDLWLNNEIRPMRDLKLIESDKYLVSDFPITEIKRDEWKAYRQDLRDFPDTLTSITETVIWPTKPS